METFNNIALSAVALAVGIPAFLHFTGKLMDEVFF